MGEGKLQNSPPPPQNKNVRTEKYNVFSIRKIYFDQVWRNSTFVDHASTCHDRSMTRITYVLIKYTPIKMSHTGYVFIEMDAQCKKFIKKLTNLTWINTSREPSYPFPLLASWSLLNLPDITYTGSLPPYFNWFFNLCINQRSHAGLLLLQLTYDQYSGPCSLSLRYKCLPFRLPLLQINNGLWVIKNWFIWRFQRR